MLFNEIKPGERFHILDIPKVDKYTALSVFKKYGEYDQEKRFDNANAIDLDTGREYEFDGDENVERLYEDRNV